MLFDSHAHVDDKRFDADRAEVIARLAAGGVTGFLNVGADMASSARSLTLAEQYDNIYAAVGVHPHDAKDVRESDYDQLAAWAAHPKVVAIGETGLDYYYNLSPREVQQRIFIRHLDLARQLDLPFIIHDRDAHGDVLAIIKKEAKGLRGVFHCFSGSLEMAREVIKLGFYVSLAGPVTYPNAAKLKEVAASVPLERLLIETDSPYLTPQPHRGRRNEPAHVRYVAETIAALRGLSLEQVAAATAANARELFRLP
ncbi:hydrolase, TatD family [Thermosinus carboxydivorans Nor1]|uniref:Hydrolase, TatD family n=1 Tax=Thermosinus carboxydivorans Nor1 TaxID=401526 RepID=A1HPT0_9FIRM|nr:TatD family hydrolase [Thermosinus carboxydivorans]EAX48049.1 hydrolase, TatD family [Thermosinus carboxydivorans Nor1]